MELTNDFRVDVPIERAWQVLTDVERIAPCMPGAQLTGVDGDDYLGTVKVKVGPITAQYKGKASFQEKDEAARRAVIKAEGRETRGQGNANALITAVLREDGGGTAVSVSTDLTITGKAAQFGRGVLADVSAKLLQQFVASLEADVLRPDGTAASEAPAEVPTEVPPTPAEPTEPAGPVEAAAAAATAVTPAASGPTEAPAEPAAPAPAAPPSRPAAPVAGPEPEPINLLGTVAGPLAKRLAPVLLVLLVVALVVRRLRRP